MPAKKAKKSTKARYQCQVCDYKSSKPMMCCGKPMKKMK